MNRIVYWIGCIIIGAGTSAIGFPAFIDGKFQWGNLCVLLGGILFWISVDGYLSHRKTNENKIITCLGS